MTEISGSRATARIQEGCSVTGSSRATTSGRSRRMAGAHLDGEFQAARDHRKVGEAAARQAARIRNRKVDFSGHSVGFLSQHLDDAISRASVSCVRSVARLFSLMA